jgi:hypothetical protein
MAGITNRGKLLLLQYAFRTSTRPANYYLALVTSATAPTQDHNTLSELTEIAAGNGYTAGGYSLTPGDTDFDVNTENDSTDLALVQLKDVVWTAAGGNLPASGNGARYAVLLTNEGTVGTRQIIAYFDLVSDRTVSIGQTLTAQNCEMQLTES